LENWLSSELRAVESKRRYFVMHHCRWVVFLFWGLFGGVELCRAQASAQAGHADGKGQAHATGSTNAEFMGPGTVRMAELLAQALKKQEENPTQTGFLNKQAVAFYDQALKAALQKKDHGEALDYDEAFKIQARLGNELLNAGESEKALKVFNALTQNVRTLAKGLDPSSESDVELSRALCYLRIGEQENCLTNHTIDSCLMPISKGGIHRLERGSRGAIEVLTKMLQRDKKDFAARWLLNIAYMTLGEYPDKVPARWLVPPTAFQSDYDIKRFPDVAGTLGLDLDGFAGGSIAEDFDGDGNLDLMVSRWNLDKSGQLRFFRNNGDGTFTERTMEAGLRGIVGGLNMMQTDYNNDGYPDVFMLRGAWNGAGGHHPCSLLRNNKDGTFEDVTEAAGLLRFHPTQTAAWFDFNGDGWLDVFIGNESNGSDLNPCELFRNNGDGTFTECAADAGLAVVKFVKGVASGDFNNDGHQDLFLSIRNGPNVLFRNDGGAAGTGKWSWKFTDVSRQAGITESRGTFPTWFWDYNNDGLLDILVTGYVIRDVSDVARDYLGIPNQGEKARLYKNNGDGTFSDVTSASGLFKVLHAMGSNFGDLDNDGWLDFYLGTGDPSLSTLIPNRMFRNADGKFFQDVTTSGGFGHIQKGHGISFADFDNDGDQDIYEVMGGAYAGDNYRNVLFLNPGHGNHWITLKLEGIRSNRAAMGARIRVTVQTAQGERSIYKTVSTGGSFGASPLRQEIGLGQAKAIRSVEIFWPSTGKTQILTGLSLDHFYKVREDEKEAVAWNLKSFPMPSKSAPDHSHHHHAAVAE
jgi:hypothetical protein